MRPIFSRSWSRQVSSSATVCWAKNAGSTRLDVISHAVALAPFSQNSNGCGSAGLGQAQLTQSNPPGLFWWPQQQRAADRDVLAHQGAAEGADGPPAARWAGVRLDRRLPPCAVLRMAPERQPVRAVARATGRRAARPAAPRWAASGRRGRAAAPPRAWHTRPAPSPAGRPGRPPPRCRGAAGRACGRWRTGPAPSSRSRPVSVSTRDRLSTALATKCTTPKVVLPPKLTQVSGSSAELVP